MDSHDIVTVWTAVTAHAHYQPSFLSSIIPSLLQSNAASPQSRCSPLSPRLLAQKFHTLFSFPHVSHLVLDTGSRSHLVGRLGLPTEMGVLILLLMGCHARSRLLLWSVREVRRVVLWGISWSSFHWSIRGRLVVDFR